MDTDGIGFIGAGFAAGLHAHALGPLRGITCELAAVCSPTRERAQAFAEKFRILTSTPTTGLSDRPHTNEQGGAQWTSD